MKTVRDGHFLYATYSKILIIQTYRPEEIVSAQIRMLLKEMSDKLLLYNINRYQLFKLA